MDGALGLRVGSVELVPQHHDPHLSQIFYTEELFLDHVVDREAKESFGCISPLLGSFNGMLKVGVNDLPTSGPIGMGRRSLY